MINDANGVILYVQRFDIGKPRNKSFRALDEWINKILIKYCKEKGILYHRTNSKKYKGSFCPVVANGSKIQENFSQFARWMKTNYEPINEKEKE